MAHTDERALSVVCGSGEGAVNMRRYRNHPHRKVPASSRFLCFSCLDLEFCELQVDHRSAYNRFPKFIHHKVCIP